MAKVKLGLQDQSVPEKTQLGDTVHTSMTGNANYVTPVPTLAELLAAKNALATAFATAVAARQASEQATALLNQKEDVFDLVMTQLGNYVETTSGGDEAKILSAGMQVASGRTPPAPMPKVENVAATPGDLDGECDLVWKPVKRKTNYIVEVSPDPVTPTSWSQAGLPTKSNFTVSGLVSGAKYWFRVAASASLGAGPRSDPATSRAT